MKNPVVKPFPYTPILGWSSTRYDTFKLCKRKYYYTYYAKFDPEYKRYEIDKLKGMTTIPLEIGNIVHDMNKVLLERLQKTEEPINKDRYYDFVRRKTDYYCGRKLFAEVYYKEKEAINTGELYKKIKTCLDNFMESDRYHWLITKAVNGKENWIIEPGGYGETRIDGMKAYSKVDFLLPVNNQFYILDWKTGKADPDKHNRQLLGYTAWASYHLNQPVEVITPIVAYLFPEYRETEVSLNEFDLQEFTSRVRTETDEMQSYCKDISENIPDDKDRFVMTDNTVLCGYCNFRELCGRRASI